MPWVNLPIQDRPASALMDLKMPCWHCQGACDNMIDLAGIEVWLRGMKFYFDRNSHVSDGTYDYDVRCRLDAMRNVRICPVFGRRGIQLPILDIELVVVGEDFHSLSVDTGSRHTL